MNRPAYVAVGAALAALGGMQLVSAGLVPEAGFDEPIWYLLVAVAVGYWVVFVAWARSA